MIALTGGAGFIGSAMLWRLNQEGIGDVIVVDRLGSEQKWKNPSASALHIWHRQRNFS